jgi:chemotaxis protein MotA
LLRGLLAPAVIMVSVAVASLFWPEFLDIPSLLLTVGGSLGVILFSYSPGQLREIVQVAHALLVEKPVHPKEFAGELSYLAQLYRAEGVRGLEHAERRLSEPFLRRAAAMLVDLQKEEQISATLERDLADAFCLHEILNQILCTLTKTFPAFGLIGTLVGMVLLLRDLYSQDVQSLPAALSLAVLTTLYGAVFANVLVAPLAARLNAAATEKELRMQLTSDWALALVRNDAAASGMSNGRRTRFSLDTALSTKKKDWILFPSTPERQRI